VWLSQVAFERFIMKKLFLSTVLLSLVSSIYLNYLRAANGKGESILFWGSGNSAECSHIPDSEWFSKTGMFLTFPEDSSDHCRAIGALDSRYSCDNFSANLSP
jgi:hypothetical protein